MRGLPTSAIFSKFFGIVTISSIGAFVSLLWLILLITLGGGEAGMVPFSLVGFAVSSLALAYTVFWVKSFRYELTDREAKIEQGVIAKSYDSILYSRIQNVGIERSLLERMFGISTVNIHTAGHSGYGSSAEGSIPGVEKEIAEEVRESIMQRARGNESGM